MDVDLAADAEVLEGRDGALGPEMLHVAHAGAGLLHQALADHLVVGVERAVEEDERRALEAVGERRVDLGAARHIIESACRSRARVTLRPMVSPSRLPKPFVSASSSR